MNRNEILGILSSLNEHISGMTDKELFNHMVNTSPSFRKTLSDLNEFIDKYSTSGTPDVFVELKNNIISKDSFCLDSSASSTEAIALPIITIGTNTRINGGYTWTMAA